MPSWNFGGTYNTANYYCGPWGAGDNFWYTDGYPMPTARTSLTGTQPIYVADIFGQYADGPVSDVTIVYAAVETSGGSLFGSSGGVAQLRYRFNGGGTMAPGRNTGNGFTAICNRTGTVRPGGITGDMTYGQVSTAVQSLNVTRGTGSGQLNVNFSGPADNGGLAISNYTIQRAPASGGPWTTVGTTVTGSNVITLTPGAYFIRVYANNAAGSSVASTTASAVQTGGGGRRYDGTSWNPFTSAQRFNGTTWINLVTRKRYDGTNWIDLTN